MIRFLAWETHPRLGLRPVLKDDRELLPPELVRSVLAWLDREEARFRQLRKPTDQIIFSDAPTRYLHDGKADPLQSEAGLRSWEFESGTFEILQRDRSSKLIVGSYHYLNAREIHTDLRICGPFLWFIPKGMIN